MTEVVEGTAPAPVVAQVMDWLAIATKDFAKDDRKVADGVWMPWGGLEYRITRAHRSNAAFAKMMEAELRPYQWAIQRDNLAGIGEAVQPIIKRVYATTVLTGVRLPSGEVLPYKPEDGVRAFGALPDLWDEVYKFANNGSHYTPDQIKDDSKN